LASHDDRSVRVKAPCDTDHRHVDRWLHAFIRSLAASGEQRMAAVALSNGVRDVCCVSWRRGDAI
jgi:hypothetical protein